VKPVLCTCLLAMVWGVTTALAQPYGLKLEWGQTGSGDGQFIAPQGIAVDVLGHVYVAETFRVQEFNDAGTFIRKWGRSGTGNGQFTNDMDIAVDRDGSVFVSDGDAARIQKFAPGGVFVASWGSRGAMPGQFGRRGLNITVDDSYVYVADYENANIQRFDKSGSFVNRWATLDDSVLTHPCGISADGDGNLFVSCLTTVAADSITAAFVLQYNATGDVVGKWGHLGSAADEFSGPCRLSARNNQVVTCDIYGRRVALFTYSGVLVAPIAADYARQPFAVAMDDSGNIFLSDYNRETVAVFAPGGTTGARRVSMGALKSRFRR
jgi:tripartite motif-containing protein 71